MDLGTDTAAGARRSTKKRQARAKQASTRLKDIYALRRRATLAAQEWEVMGHWSPPATNVWLSGYWHCANRADQVAATSGESSRWAGFRAVPHHHASFFALLRVAR